MMITKCETCGATKAICERCGDSWFPTKSEPKRCAMCGTKYWNIKKGTNPRGRPWPAKTPPPPQDGENPHETMGDFVGKEATA
jgi:ribosomal protein L37E